MERLNKRESILAARLIIASRSVREGTNGLAGLVDEQTTVEIHRAMIKLGWAVLNRHEFEYAPDYAQIVEFVQIGHRP